MTAHGPSYCPTCHEYMGHSSGHECEPEWACDIDGQEWGTARGEDAAAAAENAAERWWQDDPPDSGDTCLVRVHGDVEQLFTVTADWSLKVTSHRKRGTGETP